MTKQELRKIYLNKRQALTETEYNDLNKKLSAQFFSKVDLSKISLIHSFLPIEKTREPNTWLIIKRIQKEYPNLKISVPRINNQTSIIDHFYFENEEQLEKNMWGIPEPKQGIPTPLDKIDIVLVPLLAFDEEGNRVGYGRGFYDKFLAQCGSSVKKIGLSFYESVKNISDVNSNDIKLTHAVTPEKLYAFQ